MIDDGVPLSPTRDVQADRGAPLGDISADLSRVSPQGDMRAARGARECDARPRDEPALCRLARERQRLQRRLAGRALRALAGAGGGASRHRRRVRHLAPRGPHWGVPAGEPGEDAVRGRVRVRVPLPQPDPRPRGRAHRHLAVGGDGRHARGAAACPGRRLPLPRHMQHCRLVDRARDRRRRLPARWAGDRSSVDQGLLRPAGRADSDCAQARKRARDALAGGAVCEPRRDARASGPAAVCARAEGDGVRDGKGIQVREQLPLPWARVPLPGGAGGRAQAQGDLVHSRRGLPRRRDEARPDRAHRPVHARRHHRANLGP
mmetsp:Transcript_13247/g.42363  ORF Transcript_13247/g.42363 Transcript_13247/m.42363 type:complete len:319 (+) Transcript_13247:1112-2068(+)